MAVYYNNFSVSGDPQAKFKNVQQDDEYIKFDLYFSRYCYESESDIPSNVAIAYVVTTWSVWFNGTGEGTKNATSRIEHGVSPGESEKGELVVRFRAKQYVNGSYLQTLDFGDFKSSSITVKMEATGEELDNFYWISSSRNIQSGYEFSDYITADKWNELVEIVEFLIDTDYYKDWAKKDDQGRTLYSSISSCYVDEGDEVDVKTYNSIRFNIGQNYGTGIKEEETPIGQGEIIYPIHFNGLQTGINKWINNYNKNYT